MYRGKDKEPCVNHKMNILSGFGMSAETEMTRVADVLAYAAANANTNVQQMGVGMSYVAPISSAMGVSFEETAAAMGILSDSGIQAERAGTGLRGILGALGAPTKELTKRMGALGVSVDDVNPNVHGLAGIIANLEKAGVKASDAIELVGLNSGPALATLLSIGSKELVKFTGEMKNAKGTAQEMMDVQTDNLKGDLKSLSSHWETLQISMYKTIGEGSRGIVQFTTSIVSGVIKIYPYLEKLITGFGGLFKYLAGGIAVVAGIKLALAALSGVMMLVGGALTPILLIGATIGGLVFVIKEVGDSLGIFDKFSEYIGKVKNAAKDLWSVLKGKSDAKGLLDGLGFSEETVARVDNLVNDFKGIVVPFKAWMKGEAGSSGDLAKALGFSDVELAKMSDYFSTLRVVLGDFSGELESMKDNVIASLAEFDLMGAFDAVFGGFSGGNMSLLSMLIPPNMHTQFNELFVEPLRTGVETVVGFFDSIQEAIQRATSAESFGELAYITTLFDPLVVTFIAIGSAFENLVENFKVKLEEWWSIIEPSMEDIKVVFHNAWDFITDVFQTALSIISPLLSALGDAFSIVGDIVAIVWTSIVVPFVNFLIVGFQTVFSVLSFILPAIATMIQISFKVLRVVWDTILKPFVAFVAGLFAATIKMATNLIKGLGKGFKWVGDQVQKVTGWLSSFIDKIKNVKIPDWLSKFVGGGTVNIAPDPADSGGGKKGKGHYHGLDNVPYDGYQATLHKGERVLTAQEVRAERNGERSSMNRNSGTGGVTINNLNLYAGNKDAQALATEIMGIIASELDREGGQR